MLHVVDLHYVGDKYMVETGRVFVVLVCPPLYVYMCKH